MQSDKDRLVYLLTHDNWTEDDRRWVESYALHKGRIKWKRLLRELFDEDVAVRPGAMDEKISERIYAKVKQRIVENRTPVIPLKKEPVRRWPWGRIAVVSAIFLATGYIGWVSYVHTSIGLPDAEKSNIIPPGTDGAILTFADGKTVTLDSSMAETSMLGSGIKVEKHRLLYNVGQADNETDMNILKTPRGRQYQIVLSDGTHIWLNAGSSLYYPTVFSGRQRSVTLKGEAYFEVAKNKNKPFLVKFETASGMGEIKVLGTHFDVKAYADDPSVQATLLEGSVDVNVSNEHKIIVPGQQAVITPHLAEIKVQSVPGKEVIGWKNGEFDFDDTPITEILRQLSRWYDVDINYENGLPDQTFGGVIPKDRSLNDVLQILAISGVKFHIVGRKVKVEN